MLSLSSEQLETRNSPYINRFVQPDTIIPNPSNPQSWNRFSYVTNRPTVATDPTGHVQTCGTSADGGCGNAPPPPPENDYCDTHPVACGGDPDDELSGVGGTGNDETNNPLIDIFETIIHDDLQALEDNNCFTQGSETIDWTNSKCVDAVSFLAQDMATLSSSLSATWTAFLTLVGCTAEGLGCGVGYGFGYLDHLFFFNPLESTASFISFGLTVYSDLLTHDTYFNNPTDWGFGEDTKTGFATFVAGSLAIEPFIDAGIDIYASGYNHGYFCGISTVAACIESMMRSFP